MDEVASQHEEGRDEGPRRFLPVLARMSAYLVPEYLVVVFAVGTFAGWLFPLGESARSWGVLGVLVALVLGLLLVPHRRGGAAHPGARDRGFGPAVVGARCSCAARREPAVRPSWSWGRWGAASWGGRWSSSPRGAW